MPAGAKEILLSFWWRHRYCSRLMQQINPAQASSNRPKHYLYGFIMALLCFTLLEGVARLIMPPHLKTARDILLGEEQTHLLGLQNTIGHPYLSYICAPNFSHPVNGPQHNPDGYRGEPVPLDKSPDVLRILCLGGSTTYGYTVPKPEQAYPAVLEGILKNQPPPRYRDVEVINGGLPWGTTAELLTHYIFKYHYYKPDIVIINIGGNDAEGYTYPYYHPDGSNWRKPMMNLLPLPKSWRWLAKSQLICLPILEIFYRDQLHGGQFVISGGSLPEASWFKPNGNLIKEPREVPVEQLSFYHNTKTLIGAIQADGAMILLVPFRAAPLGYQRKPFELSQILRHEQLLKDLAAQYRLGYAPFPASVISPSNWTDHCHLNVDGEQQKAKHIAEHLVTLIKASGPSP
jgi:lysophospholipase L1-like esterase